ncbi:hypothetical protein ACH5RR_005676 [Cinchona calisaya]|uniref:Brix domain-containing protein n=1 Tax=Cinchona calisaya TaxID=153742 RepID=A0ABD3ALW1_9GENT
MPEAYPHLILNNFATELGERTLNILMHLFPVPKADTKQIITFANQSDYISFRVKFLRSLLFKVMYGSFLSASSLYVKCRHHIYEKRGGPKSLEVKNIGPCFELKLYQIKLGTMDQDEAQTEWVLRPYMNTSKKRKILGD